MIFQIQKKIKQRHDEKSLRRKLAHKAFVHARNKFHNGLSKAVIKEINDRKQNFWDYKRIKAPSNFSLINNPNEVLQFISKLNEAYNKHKKVFVVLYNVVEMTNDAIVLLLSNVAQFKAAHIDFNGDKPRNPHIAKQIEDSGFYRILYQRFRKDDDTIDLSNKSIYTHAQKNVDSELTAKIISKNSEFLWNEPRRCQGVQRIFIELMQNTNNHASHTVGDKYWWMSVSRRTNPNTLCFSFIDYGMGIFKSLSSKKSTDKFYGWMEKIKQIINPEKHHEVLASMLSGEFHRTVTNKYFRGKGLPGIYKALEQKSITKLIVISNDAYANPTEDHYSGLNFGLDGTFVYFELDETCNNCKEQIY